MTLGDGMCWGPSPMSGFVWSQPGHPLDQQNTSLMRNIPGLELVAKGFLGPAAEQVLLLENIANSVKIGPHQLPSVHQLLVEAAHTLQMDLPELYVRQNPVPNAYTLAITGRQPFIVIHTALLELLAPRELQAVLAHELGHLKCDHGLWLTVANVLASGTVSMLPVVSGVVEEALLRWLRAAELTCDRAALLVAQDPKVVVGALMKLAGGSPSFASQLNVDAFLEQARSYEQATSGVLGWYLRNAQTRALSHPLPVMRAREIDRWAHSVQFKALLARNRQHTVQVVEYSTPQPAMAADAPATAQQPGTNGSSLAAAATLSKHHLH
ncbi:peptidase family M48-domain-containing protein [Haematococcus lacustris]